MAKLKCAHCSVVWDPKKYDSHAELLERAAGHMEEHHPKASLEEPWLVPWPPEEES